MPALRAATADAPPHALGRTFASFANRNYRLYWFGQLFSVCGTWIARVAQAWLVLKLTDSSLALGVVSALQALPLTFFALFGGVLADRLPKRPVLMVTQSLMAAQSLALAALVSTGHVRLWQIYALAFGLGLATAFDNPARQAFVSEMVGPENLPNAVALNSSLFNAARIVGPAIGGALIAGFDIAVPFFVNAASFLAVIVGLALMRPSEFHGVPWPARGPVLQRLQEGIRYAARTPDVAFVLIMLFFVGTFGYNFTVILPLIAHYTLGSDALGFGGLLTAMGCGSLVAALGIAYRASPSQRILVASTAAFAVLLGLLAFVQWLPLMIAILVLLGVASITFSSTTNTLLQLGAPGELRGRVMSLYIMLMMGTAPLGSVMIGWLAEHVGVGAATGAMAALSAVGILLGLLYRASHRPEPA